MGKPKKYDFSGWATKNNLKCADGRTILKHAFKENDGATVPLVWNHNHQDQESVLGHAYLENREEGVYAYCSFNETEQGKHAKELVQHGDIVALSIYANQLKQNSNKEVIHGNIREVSLVLAGANPGAYIETVLAHSDSDEEEAKIYHVDETDSLEMYHADPDEKETDSNKKEKTIQEIVDSMTEEQKQVLYLLVGAASEDSDDDNTKNQETVKHNIFDSEDLGGEEKMKFNIFEGITNKDGSQFTHSDFNAILEEAKKGYSLKDSVIAHGIEGIENLMPEYKTVNKGLPTVVNYDQTWVDVIMSGIVHVPFSKIKSTYFDITADEARANGWLPDNVAKDKKKVEETILAFKRTTDPQMVYKKQSIDRDDEIDITDFSVVAFIKEEMKGKWREEVARAILVGDGRDALSTEKIKEDRIRPIAKDDNHYTMTRNLGTASSTVAELAGLLVDDSVRAMEDYKGSGNITAFVRRDVVSAMLLLKDLNQHRIYKNLEELATAMLVNKIVAVPSNIMGDVLCVEIDLKDYNLGSNPEGKDKFFDDFDIDFNKQKYLIEGKCSGANVQPYSAFVFKKPVATSGNDNSEQAQG